MKSIRQQLADDFRDFARMYRDNWTLLWLPTLRSSKFWKFTHKLVVCVVVLGLSFYILFHTPR